MANLESYVIHKIDWVCIRKSEWNKTEQYYGECVAVSELISLLENCCELIWQCANANREDALRIYHVLEESLYNVKEKMKQIVLLFTC